MNIFKTEIKCLIYILKLPNRTASLGPYSMKVPNFIILEAARSSVLPVDAVLNALQSGLKLP